MWFHLIVTIKTAIKCPFELHIITFYLGYKFKTWQQRINIYGSVNICYVAYFITVPINSHTALTGGKTYSNIPFYGQRRYFRNVNSAMHYGIFVVYEIKTNFAV